MAALSGQRIRRVDIVTAAPRPLPGLADAIGRLHARTRVATVRRRLLFAPGDTVDTLRVAESLRALRRLSYLAEVDLAASRCTGGGVALAVATRDAWSARPTVRVRGSGSTRLGFEERNLLGTGRSARVYVRSDAGRVGVGVGYTDPWLFGSNVSASVGRSAYRDGASWDGVLATPQRSAWDPWRAQLTASRSVIAARGGAAGAAVRGGDSVYRDGAQLLVARRVAASPAGVTALIAGAEVERAAIAAGPGTRVAGPRTARRTFAGVDVGLARRPVRYAPAGWLLGPGAGAAAVAAAELPASAEAEAVVGVGRDFASARPAVHADLWAGRAWMPGRAWLVTTDAWASGFRVGPEWTAASARAAVDVTHPGRRGLWSMRLAAEQLTDPDPDVRALASVDPTLGALRSRGGLAETAVAASAERSFRIRSAGPSYALDAAVFGAGSLRWDPAARLTDQGGGRLYVGAVGVGLRLSPARFGRAALRLDVAIPVARSPGLPGRPFLALTVSPAIGAGRRRNGSLTP